MTHFILRDTESNENIALIQYKDFETTKVLLHKAFKQRLNGENFRFDDTELKSAIEDDTTNLTVYYDDEVSSTQIDLEIVFCTTFDIEEENDPKEQRVYMVNISNRQHPDELSDEQFMALAEEQGTIWSLNNFADDFNKGIIDFNNKIRII